MRPASGAEDTGELDHDARGGACRLTGTGLDCRRITKQIEPRALARVTIKPNAEHRYVVSLYSERFAFGLKPATETFWRRYSGLNDQETKQGRAAQRDDRRAIGSGRSAVKNFDELQSCE